MRRRTHGARLLGACGVFGAVVFLAIGPAGASVTNTVPWPADEQFSSTTLNSSGECHENLVVPATGLDTSTVDSGGLRIQEACQGFEPFSGVDMLALAPPLLFNGQDYYSSGWHASSGFSQWANVVTSLGTGNILTMEAGSGSCTALYALIYYDTVDGEVNCVPQSSASPVVWNFSPSGLTGGANCWTWVSQRLSQATGPTETVSGKTYAAVSFTELWTMNNQEACTSPYASGATPVGGKSYQETQDKTLQSVDSVLDPSETACPFTGSMGPAATNVDGVSYSSSGVAAGSHGQPLWTTGSSSTLVSYGSTAQPPDFEVSQLTCSNTYSVGGDVWEATMPSTFFTGGTASGAALPCTVTSATGPPSDANYQEHHSYTWSVVLAGSPTPSGLIVDPGDDPNENQGFGQVGTISTGAHVAGDLAVDGDYFGLDAEYSPTDANGAATVTVTFDYAANTDVELFCVAGGHVYFLADSRSLALGGNGATFPADDVNACFASGGSFSGVSLLNPFSWLGLLNPVDDAEKIAHDVACELTYLWVPQSCSNYFPNTNIQWPASSVFGQTTQCIGTSNPLSTALSSHVPFSWMTDAASAFSTINGNLNSSISSGACSPPSIGNPFASLASHFGSHGSVATGWTITLPAPASLGCTSATDATTVGELFGYRVLLRDVMSLAIWLAVLWTCWRMMPFSRSGDGVQAVTGSGLNNEGHYIPTVWTNEPSDEF